MKKQFVVVICGPTASGKTAIAIRLAKKYGGEIISADSMQIYKGMDIATAKPTKEERNEVPHYLVDFQDTNEGFSVAQYVQLAHKCIEDIGAKGKIPFIVGGTGLYISSLIDNLDFGETECDYEYREELRKKAHENGNEYVLNMLAEIDPDTAKTLHPNNLNRIIRALEVYKTTGRKMSELKEDSRKNPSMYEPCMIALDYDRQVLYDRINSRVDIMLSMGLIDEAKEFYQRRDYPTAAQAIGYKELKPYLEGKCELQCCVDELKKETRHYAKRQLTWLKPEKRISWIRVERDTTEEDIIKCAEGIIDKALSDMKRGG